MGSKKPSALDLLRYFFLTVHSLRDKRLRPMLYLNSLIFKIIILKTLYKKKCCCIQWRSSRSGAPLSENCIFAFLLKHFRVTINPWSLFQSFATNCFYKLKISFIILYPPRNSKVYTLFKKLVVRWLYIKLHRILFYTLFKPYF